MTFPFNFHLYFFLNGLLHIIIRLSFHWYSFVYSSHMVSWSNQCNLFYLKNLYDFEILLDKNNKSKEPSRVNYVSGKKNNI